MHADGTAWGNSILWLDGDWTTGRDFGWRQTSSTVSCHCPRASLSITEKVQARKSLEKSRNDIDGTFLRLCKKPLALFDCCDVTSFLMWEEGHEELQPYLGLSNWRRSQGGVHMHCSYMLNFLCREVPGKSGQGHSYSFIRSKQPEVWSPCPLPQSHTCKIEMNTLCANQTVPWEEVRPGITQYPNLILRLRWWVEVVHYAILQLQHTDTSRMCRASWRKRLQTGSSSNYRRN